MTALCSVIQPIFVVCGWAVQLTEEHCNANISREEPERVVCNSVARTVSLRKTHRSWLRSSVIQPVLVVCVWDVNMTEDHCNTDINWEEPERLVCNSVARTCVTNKSSSVVTAQCSVIQPVLVVCLCPVNIREITVIRTFTRMNRVSYV